MFLLVVRYLGFLKSVPLLPLVFDNLLRLISAVTQRNVLIYMDDIETEVNTWPGMRITLHKYGGVQFNHQNTELGHIHGNGLLDMLLNKQIKAQLLKDGRVQDHHSFINSGWISFYIKTADDKYYALYLLELAYQHKKVKSQ